MRSRESGADAGGGDVHLVGFAVLDDLGIAAGDRRRRLARRLGHGANLGFQDVGGQACFEDVS